MLVDGQLAGVAFPYVVAVRVSSDLLITDVRYAVIFTGGIDPTAWRFALAAHTFASLSDLEI